MRTKMAIVIGGGIAGCSSAYALAQRGIQVTLLERRASIASEASGNPQAMLYPRLSGDDTASQFSLASYHYSLNFFKTLDLLPADFNVCGMLQLGFNTRELARIQKVAAYFASADWLNYVTADQASALAGIALAHDALYFPQAAWVNPQSLCLRLARHKNILIKTLTNANKLLKNNDVFEVYSNDQCIEKADVVIIANANEAQNMGLDLNLRTQSIRGQVSLVNASARSSALNTIICSDGYLCPAQQTQHCLGATFSTENTDIAIDVLDHQANLARLKVLSMTLYDDLKDQISGGRVSFRCTSADYFPLAGELCDSAALKSKPPRHNAQAASLPWIKGLYLNIAHGSRGFTSAPLCAELLACFICDETPPLPDALAGLLNPNRFLLRKLGLKRLAKTLATSATTGMTPPISG
ncbi:MAG: FAD-dependent oxidoreductase [Methylotenera sp.]|nr:FAD-dependent oxidoreductase [Methylotenera sp.]